MKQPFPIEIENNNNEKLQDRPFNPWRIPKTEKAKRIVQEVITQVQNYETIFGLRKRRRRKDDQARFEAAVTAISCDLMHHYLTGTGDGVFITRSHKVLGSKGRYSPPAYSKALPDIMDRMASPELDFVDLSIGHEGHFGPAKRTTIRAGKRLLTRIVEHGITQRDLGVSQDQEVILLKRCKEDYWDEGGLIDYRDTARTREFRKQVHAINDWLEKIDLNFDEALSDKDKYFDLDDRRLRRIFTQGRFDSGGRLFGGFWQGLTKEQRREGLAIDGQDAVELDYGQVVPRILYGLVGIEPTFEDAYAIPGFEAYRTGIKKVMNSMLFKKEPLIRMPKGVRKEFATRHKITEVVKAIEDVHPDIRHKFFTGIGHELQFLESQIMVDVLLSLMKEDAPALPIHDAVMVPRSKVVNAKEIMHQVFLQHTGIPGMVSIHDKDDVGNVLQGTYMHTTHTLP